MNTRGAKVRQSWTPERRLAQAEIMRLRVAKPGFSRVPNRPRSAREQMRAAIAETRAQIEKEKSMQPEPAHQDDVSDPTTQTPFLVLDGTGDTNGHVIPTRPDTPETQAEDRAAEQELAAELASNDQERVRKHWSQDERRQVIIEIARLMRKQGLRHVPDAQDRLGRQIIAEYLAAAQLTLPRERRRLAAKPAHMGEMFWTLVEGALTTKADILTPSPDPATTPRNGEGPDEPAVVSPPAPAAPEPPEGKALVPAEDPLRDVPLAALLQAAFSRVLTTVTQAKADALKVGELEQLTNMQAEDLHQMTRSNVELHRRISALETALKLNPAREEKLPRVAIVGCRAYEFDHIRHGCDATGLKLDLRHYSQDSNPTKIHADWAIVMKWGSHAWQDQVTAAIPAKQSIFLNGGVGMTINQLKTWFQS